MNTSQYMDKQIMDLTSSPQSSQSELHHSTGGGKDFIDLMNHPREDDDQHANYAGNGTRKEDVIVPSYDFHPIRPVAGGGLGGGGDSTGGGAAARAWSSVDGKSSSVNVAIVDSPVRHYGSLDSMEPSRDVLEKERTVSDSAILSEIDRTMKRHADNMLIVLEGVSSRLMQLESRTRHLESSVDDLKVSVGNNHGSTDGKMRQLENILREVQTGVQAMKDKQELLESQLHLQNLHVSNVNQNQPEPQNTGQAANAVQQAPPSASAPPQSPHQHAPPSLTTFPQSLPSLPGPPPPQTVPLPQQQSLPPVTPLPNQFTPPPSIPQRDPYYVPAGHAHEPPPNPQYQVAPPQQPSPAAAPPPLPHQLYQTAPLPPYQQQQSQIPQQPHLPAGHHSDEASYLASQSYPPRQQPAGQLLGGGTLPSQQYYGAPPSSAGYNPPQSGSMEMYPYGGGGGTMVKPLQLLSASMSPHGGGGGTGYPQLPTARVLPQGQGSPARSSAGVAGSGSGSGNRVPIDDVIDKVATMGFPRDHVREAVRKLTENGQSVDLNVVLDKLMNDSDFQPPRGWFGR